jgi:hypothetical protein
MFQKPPLAFHTSSVTGKRSIGSDHPVTGHNNPDGIGAVRKTNGSHSSGTADPLGELCVGDGGTAWDISQFLPHNALEVGAAGLHGESIDSLEIARKIAANCMKQCLWSAVRFEIESLLAVVKPKQALHTRFIVRPIHSTQVPGVIPHNQQLANGSVYPIDP